MTITDDTHAAGQVCFTNWRGVTYVLCAIATKTGKTRLVASRTIVGTPLSAMPEGYEFAENVNGQVSVRRVRPPTVAPEELETVRKTLASTSGCQSYRAAIVGNAVVIYEPSMRPLELNALTREFPYFEDIMRRVRSLTASTATYSPLVRFVLSDKTRRTFDVERRVYSGDEGWLPVEEDRPLAPAARGAARRLGPNGPRDEFYEWG